MCKKVQYYSTYEDEKFRWGLKNFPKIIEQVSGQSEFITKLVWFQRQALFD